MGMNRGERNSQTVERFGCPQGFEPRYADPESAVLPLNEGAAKNKRWCAGALIRLYEQQN